jgi:hypothetical protein
MSLFSWLLTKIFAGGFKQSPTTKPREVRVCFFRGMAVYSPPHVCQSHVPARGADVSFSIEDYQQALKQLEETGHGSIIEENVNRLDLRMSEEIDGRVYVGVSAIGFHSGNTYRFDTYVKDLQLPETSTD